MKSYCFILIYSCLCICCVEHTNITSEEPIATHSLSNIRGKLSLEDSLFQSSRTLQVKAVIMNHSAQTLKLNSRVLNDPILALNVLNQQGQRMPTIPPSLPPTEKEVKSILIKSMETYLISYNLHIFSPPLPKGYYTIQMKNMPSNNVHFEIR
ncbi:hypothetical protein [Aureispira anguillae]|uniref:Uncharacterized protein n=1 Tax=Aureispira anguillae TaxID=2864201 RepID=A0A916DQQ5_9BACT|nr:hypothetical protein [Aureispira anguillae]BDS09761.1 hypothetical protein AsAng_0004660 [Aureispira anguillae]